MTKISTHDYVGALTQDQQAKCERVRNLFKELESVVLEQPQDRSFSSRCFAIVRTKLEEACMFMIKGIAFEGKEVL